MSGLYRIISFDPGGTTGWATLTLQVLDDPVDPGKREVFEPRWNCGYLGPEEHHGKLEMLIEMHQVKETIVVCESFEFRNRVRPGTELISREYIGIIKRTCEKRDIPLHFQTASQGKITSSSFVKRTNLKKLGLYQAGKEWKHSMDAYGHLIFWVINYSPDWLKNTIGKDLLHRGWGNG